MDFGSAVIDVDKPCCSKSLTKVPRDYQKNRSNEVIVIDEDDSCDSAYETGSSLSRSSCLSSPISDAAETKEKKKRVMFYANVHYNSDKIEPWEKVTFKKESNSSKEVQNVSDTIVLSDSDDDNDKGLTRPEKKVAPFKVPNNTHYLDDDIVNLDSDEETEPIKYYIIETLTGNRMLRIPDYYIATGLPPDTDRNLAIQTRVIARRMLSHFPASYDEKKQNFHFLYKNDDNAFYPGMVGAHHYRENGIQYYLVFFDDGHVQYVPNNNIRVVFGNYGTKYVHANAQEFYDYYFSEVKNGTLREIKTYVKKQIRVFLNGNFELAQVMGYDPNKPALVTVDFVKSKQAECLFAGSPRFEPIWKDLLKDKRMKYYNDTNITMIEVSSDSEEEEEYQSPKKSPMPVNAKDLTQKVLMFRAHKLMGDKYRAGKTYARHVCSPECVKDYEQSRKIFRFDPLKRPMLAGWSRHINHICHYVTPCGRLCKSMASLYNYLKETQSKLTIDCFSLSPNIKPMTEIRSSSEVGIKYLNEIIKGGHLEKRRIPVVSIAGNFPHFNEYVTYYRRNPRSKKVPAIVNTADNPFRSCCDCTDDCSDKLKCSCWQLTLAGSKVNAGYMYKRLDSKVHTGIYECNPGCKCASNCLNRVVQAKIEQKLELYETRDRGYGIRCQTDIPKGAFISCYFGDLLHGKTADERAMRKKGVTIQGDEYFMQLDHIEMAEQYKDGYESDVSFDEDDFELIEMVSKRQKLDESLKRVELPISPYIKYFPEIQKTRAPNEDTQRTMLFGEKSDEFVVDGRYRGNISRFFNHSCDPNLFSQNVFVDTHDLRFPFIAFFAADDIKAGTELTWDYSYQIGSIVGREIQCKCGSDNCRKRLL